MVDSPEAHAQPELFALSAAVYAERDGKILILKRAMGDVTGAWYIPGGAVERGEDIELAARREMFEECGLEPAGPLSLVSVHTMPRLRRHDAAGLVRLRLRRG